MGSLYDQEKIYYFINNVLMEEERIRYKSVMPVESMFLSNLGYYSTRVTSDKRVAR